MVTGTTVNIQGARHAVPVYRYQRLSRHSRVGGNDGRGPGRPSSKLHGGSLVERELDRPVCVVLITEERVECARPQIPFMRASSAGLAGRRAAACLRLAEPSSAAPRQTEQRSEPAGPRSRVPRGIAKGGAGQAAPLGSPGRRNQDDKPTQIIINAAEVPQHGLTGRPSSNSATALHGGSSVERELDLPGWGDRIQPRSAPQIRTEIHITRRQNRLHQVMHIQLAQNR